MYRNACIKSMHLVSHIGLFSAPLFQWQSTLRTCSPGDESNEICLVVDGGEWMFSLLFLILVSLFFGLLVGLVSQSSDACQLLSATYTQEYSDQKYKNNKKKNGKRHSCFSKVYRRVGANRNHQHELKMPTFRVQCSMGSVFLSRY